MVFSHGEISYMGSVGWNIQGFWVCREFLLTYKKMYILLGRETTQGVHVLLLQYQQKLIGRLVLTASLGYSMIREKVLHESCKKMGTRSMLLLNRWLLKSLFLKVNVTASNLPKTFFQLLLVILCWWWNILSENSASSMPIIILPVLVGYFLLVVDFSIKK